MALWNSRPFDQTGPDPFGRSESKKTETGLTADSAKCPTCGANIFYEPELESMMCRDCGNIYAPDTMEPRGSLGISKEHDYMGDSDMSEDDKKRHEIVCNSCGAALVADENTMSTMCPFCGSPALITRRLTREFKPDYIVPFKIDKDQAKSIMNTWLRSRKKTPIGFRNKFRLTKMTALYVPFWLIDCGVNTDMSGTGKIHAGLETSIFEVDSTITYYVKGVPFDASLKIANKLMEAIEPFDYSDMVPFESKYLQGFYADKYEQLPTEMTERIMRRLERFSRSETSMVSKKYSEYEVRGEKAFTWLNSLSVKYCLLPVWFMNVDYDGRKYQFAVNGQTGEAGGSVPISKVSETIDRFLFRTNGKLAVLPLVIAVAMAFCCGVLMSLTGLGDLAPSFLPIVLILCQFFMVVAYFTAVLVKMGTIQKIFGGKRKTAYEINDYDKDPGMDCYFDSTRHSDLKVKETLLRHVVRITDDNGRVVDEHSIEF